MFPDKYDITIAVNDLRINMIKQYSKEITKRYFMLLGGNEKRYDFETERRIADFAKELWKKQNYDKFTLFDTDNDNMVVAHDLRLFSFCEHHLLPFFGIVNIGYLPNGKVIGLSKIQRIVDKFASCPTIQEKLTNDILNFFVKTVDSPNVIIQVKAIHTCVIARGTQSSNAQFTTTGLDGSFKDNALLRNEFYQTLNSNDKLKIF
jgi:GTP cyclohydrolase I